MAQKKIILDTDPSADPDDVGCMAMLHNLATLGECEILAIINSTEFKQSTLSISAINTFYSRPAIPIGDYHGYAQKVEASPNNYDHHLARVYPRSINSWKEAQESVALYREILASAEDRSITIAIIGTMHNFYALLRSEEDAFSSMDGKALVEQKVAEVVTMGGNFIEGKGYDRTNWGGSNVLCSYTDWSCLNEERNRMCRYEIDHCPSPFIASGWEVGCGDYYNAQYGNVMTGQGLKQLDTSHILRRSYEYHFLTRRETADIMRHSNDQCALHFAVRGEGHNYTSHLNGVIDLSVEGVCTWDESILGQQGFIQKKRDKDSIAAEIEMLMMLDQDVSDMTPPEAIKHLLYDAQQHKIVWDAATDSTIGSWVVAYHVYSEDRLVHVAFGTQLVLSDLPMANKTYEIRAVNAAGLESESQSISIE
ncbi:MAG: nucleoside hydrolase [Saprospiraceae bacterium]|nr:nucleoside hydrolase [Saprospiraceae bacterium]